MDHKVHVFAGLKKKKSNTTQKAQTQNKKKHTTKETQASCFIFIYSMFTLHKSPQCYLKIPLKVQNNLVLNLIASASSGIKLQLSISFSSTLLSHTEPLQNYFRDCSLIAITKKKKKSIRKINVFSRTQIAS